MNELSLSDFNNKDAILLAGMCFQTYELFEKRSLVLPQGFELLFTIQAVAGVNEKIEEVFGFIAESNDTIVVAFRGTDSQQDLDSDADIFQVRFPFVHSSGKTHRGVTCIYQSTRDVLIDEVQKLSSRKKLFITGHSLGGALATLFALDAAVNTKFKHPILYTLASFRVGSPDFAARFDMTVKNSFRIFNIHDPIPLSFVNSIYPPPFTKNGLYYRHVKGKFPLDFQLNNTARNHTISCYFKNLADMNPNFSKVLCSQNPGFCPDTRVCRFFQGPCSDDIW